MFLTRWLNQPGRAATPRPTFRPTVEALGDRLAPAAFSGLSPQAFAPWDQIGVASSSSSSVTGEATEFAVLARRETDAGNSLRVTVVALDDNGRRVRDYTGAVTLTSSDGAAVLPASTTFTEADRGRKSFVVTLNTVGDQTVTATDSAGLSGSARVDVDAAPVATSLFLRVERDATSGTVTRVLVAALDESNRVVRNYTGTVTLTAGGVGATVPAAYTFTAADRGAKVFEVTPSAVGDLTLTATDGAGLTGTVTVDVDPAPVATKFALIAAPRATVDEPARVLVVALDSSNRLVRNYTGTVTLTSGDAAATLPAAYTFTAADRGAKVLSVTFGTVGSQTLTASDGALSSAVTLDVREAGTFGGIWGGFRGRGRR